jgi:hypothetical protein
MSYDLLDPAVFGHPVAAARRNGVENMLVFHCFARWCAIVTVAGVCAGCGGGGGDGDGSTPPPMAPSKIFVGDSGSVPPAAPTTPAIGSSPNSNPSPGPIVIERIIQGPSTMLTSSLLDFALDVAGDRLYVSDGRSILRFDGISTAAGNVAPRVVSTCCVGGGNFTGIYLDAVNDRLYAGVNESARVIQVFDNVSSLNNSGPTRSITVNSTFLMDVAVDTTKNILYVYGLNAVSGFTEIAVFDNAAALPSPATPNRTNTIGESFSSGLGVGMFIDPVNDRLYAPRSGLVMVFDNASTKDVSTTTIPERTINLPLPDMTNITVDVTANRLYAVDPFGLNIISNASTVSFTPPALTRVVAPSGSRFKAVAVRP